MQIFVQNATQKTSMKETSLLLLAVERKSTNETRGAWFGVGLDSPYSLLSSVLCFVLLSSLAILCCSVVLYCTIKVYHWKPFVLTLNLSLLSFVFSSNNLYLGEVWSVFSGWIPLSSWGLLTVAEATVVLCWLWVWTNKWTSCVLTNLATAAG